MSESVDPQEPTAAAEVPRVAPEPGVPLPRPDWYNRTFYGGQDGPTEFSWGAGQVPAGYEQKSPAEGGAYVGRTPRQNADGTWPKVKRGQAYGVPGEQLRQ